MSNFKNIVRPNLFQEGGGMEIEDSLFSMDFDDLDVFWMVSDRVMKSRWRTMKSPGWVMKSGVFRYVCIVWAFRRPAHT